MARSKPLRFGTGAGGADERGRLLATARRAEDLGYSTFGMADHFMLPFAPLIALQAVADATTTLRLGQIVLAQGFRHPAVLAKELATLDVLSGGRVEVGIGAGWLRDEFEQAGIPFDPPSMRIEQLEEAIVVLKGLFDDEPFTFSGRHFAVAGLDGTPKPVQRPRPPILVGGGGRRLLSAAARQADIVQVLPATLRRDRPLEATSITAQAYGQKVQWIRDAAGDRFADLELGALLVELAITDEPEHAADQFLARFAFGSSSADVPSREELLASPVVAIGTVEQVCEKLRATRETFGFSYFTGPVGVAPEVLAPVIDRLAGT